MNIRHINSTEIKILARLTEIGYDKHLVRELLMKKYEKLRTLCLNDKVLKKHASYFNYKKFFTEEIQKNNFATAQFVKKQGADELLDLYSLMNTDDLMNEDKAYEPSEEELREFATLCEIIFEAKINS